MAYGVGHAICPRGWQLVGGGYRAFPPIAAYSGSGPTTTTQVIVTTNVRRWNTASYKITTRYQDGVVRSVKRTRCKATAAYAFSVR